MLSGVRFRAYPTASQEAVLRVWIGHQRFIYNAKVGEALCCTACGPRANADINAAQVIRLRGIAQLRQGLEALPKKKTARVRGLKSKVGPVRPEPGASPTPAENLSDAVGRCAANGASFAEPGNRHLNRARG